MKLKTFVHKHFLDRRWKPGPGERYVDAPKARMQVTRVTKALVWYRYAGSGEGVFKVTREDFEAEYGSPFEDPTFRPSLLRPCACGRLSYTDSCPICVSRNLRSE